MDIEKGILCPYVQKEFFTKCQDGVTTAFLSCRSHDGSFLGHIFEKLVILVVERARGRTVTFVPLPRPGTRTPPSTSTDSSGPSRLELKSGMRELRHSEDPLEELFGLPTVERTMQSAKPVLIVPTKNTNPLFDFADARNRVYQCTLSQNDHSYDGEYLLRVLFVVNYETLTASGVPVATKKKCEDCWKNMAFKRGKPITGESTFSEVTRDICGLFAAASRGTLLSLHFVWVVADPKEVQQATYREPLFKLSNWYPEMNAQMKAAMTALIQTNVLQYVWYTDLADPAMVESIALHEGPPCGRGTNVPGG